MVTGDPDMEGRTFARENNQTTWMHHPMSKRSQYREAKRQVKRGNVMVEIIVMGVVAVLAIVVLAVSSASERNRWAAERKDLLNRIMSRDYVEFAVHEPKSEAVTPMKVVPLDELRRELQADEGQPLGMPV